MAHKKELRVEARVRNNVLWHAIYDVWPTVSAFCEQYKISYQITCQLLGLRTHPLDKNGQFRATCKALSLVLDIPSETLFPLWLYEFERTRVVQEFSPAELSAPDQLRLMLPAPKDPYESLLNEELTVAVRKAIAEMHPRKVEILKMLFGMEGNEEMDLSEVGEKMGLSRERVRQLKLSAFAELSMSLKGTWSRDHILEIIARQLQRSKRKLTSRPFTHKVVHDIFGLLPVNLINLGGGYAKTFVKFNHLQLEPINYDPAKSGWKWSSL